MNNLENRLCEPTAWEILELAARYYTEQSQNYTVSELIQVGTEAQIPDRFIQQAIHDLKIQQQQKLEQQKRIKQRWGISLNISLAIASTITLGSIYNHSTYVDAQTETAFTQIVLELNRNYNQLPTKINADQK